MADINLKLNPEGEMAVGICGCHRHFQKMWCIFYFIFRHGWRGNVINLFGGGNSITSSYSAMQSVVRGDVTGRQAESQGFLHFKPNFQFSPIFLHSHWSWKLSTAHLSGEGGRGIKGTLLFNQVIYSSTLPVCWYGHKVVWSFWARGHVQYFSWLNI